MRALADNEDASYEYLQLDGGDDRIGRLETLLRPDSFGIIEDRVSAEGMSGGSPISYDDAAELADLMEQYGADAIDGATVGAVENDPRRYNTALDTYADLIRGVGEGDHPYVTQRAVAHRFALSARTIGESAPHPKES